MPAVCSSAGVVPLLKLFTFSRRQTPWVLGGHIEMNSAGDLFPWESQYHPNEHVLQMTKDDALALPTAVRIFNGFYSVNGQFTMENSIRLLIAFAVLVLGAVVAMIWILVIYVRRRRRRARMLRMAKAD
jgi:hydroxyacylglutathione hydrolase